MTLLIRKWKETLESLFVWLAIQSPIAMECHFSCHRLAVYLVTSGEDG